MGTIAFLLIAALVIGISHPIYERMEKNKYDREMNDLLKKLPKPPEGTPEIRLKK